jgi:hypothetical protein
LQFLSDIQRSKQTVAAHIQKICMDRLQFASEAVLSEVADMYPAC